MAITVTGNNPTTVTVVSTTVTTNTTFNANAPNDRFYQLADTNIIGAINAGVAVGGFGLAIQPSVVGGGIDFTNSGFVSINHIDPALELVGNGGLVTYRGTGTVTNSGSGAALFVHAFSGTGGSADVTIDGTVVANGGTAAFAAGDALTFTQGAGSFITSTGGDAVELVSFFQDLVADLNGTVIGDLRGVDAVGGSITLNLTGDIIANSQEGVATSTDGATIINSSGTISAPRGIQAVGNAAGLVTVNMTGGQINSTSAGMELVSSGTGGVVVDMSGGQIGSATQRAGGVGIIAQANGTAGAVDLTVSSLWTDGAGLLPSIGSAASTEDITVTVNGTLDVASGNAIQAENFGTGDVFITNNGTIAALGGIVATTVTGGVSIFNGGTITSVGGTAILLDDGDDTLTLAPGSVINGDVIAQAGFDTLQLGGTTGTGTFDVSDIDAGGGTEQYRFFEILTVIGATWTLTGTAAGLQNWTVSGGTLGGTATIGNLDVTGGTVAPGASAGILTTVSFGLGAAGTFAVEIGGTTPGTGHDQIAVNGATTLAGTLAPTLINGFDPAPGTEFVIIATNSIGPVNGTFAGLAEGAEFTAGGGSWRISYTGGDGNDVTLTALESLPGEVAPLADVLWRNVSGAVVTANTELGTVPSSFQIDGTGDFDGDGDADILWRHDDGLTVIWELENGNFVANHNLDVVTATFAIAATGDFDGDGDADVLWRGDEGQVVTWEIENNALVTNHNLPTVSTTWQIAGTGDFDADGDSDIVWRHDGGDVVIWEMQDGAFVVNHNLPAAPTTFALAGTGDFDGDGDADILWRHADGQVVTWEIEGNAYVVNHNLPTADPVWRIEGTHDFDDDGDADILWRHADGDVVTWEIENGAFVTNHNFGLVANTWQVQGTGTFDLA
jgi:VCBS repeat protein